MAKRTNKTKKSGSHGGKRKGSGRPANDDEPRSVSFYIPGSLIDFLDSKPEGRSKALTKILKRLVARSA